MSIRDCSAVNAAGGLLLVISKALVLSTSLFDVPFMLPAYLRSPAKTGEARLTSTLATSKSADRCPLAKRYMSGRSTNAMMTTVSQPTHYIRRFASLREVPGATQFLAKPTDAPIESRSSNPVSNIHSAGAPSGAGDRIEGHCLCGQTKTSIPGVAPKTFLVSTMILDG